MSVIEPGPKHSFSFTQPCFIVARDPALHFGGVAPAAKGFGATLREIEHPDLFRHIEEFIAEEEPNFVDSFSLAIPNTDSLIALGRFRVEIEHSEQLEHALVFERESIEDEDPRFMDIAILLNNIVRIEQKVRRLLAAGSKTPYAEKREHAKVKFLLRSYWDLLHRLCASEAERPRWRPTIKIRHVIEGLRSRIAGVSMILRPNDPDGAAARHVDQIFEFLTCCDPVEWKALQQLVPGALEAVTSTVAKSTVPDSRVPIFPEQLDEEFRRAATAHINAFINPPGESGTGSSPVRRPLGATSAGEVSCAQPAPLQSAEEPRRAVGFLGGSCSPVTNAHESSTKADLVPPDPAFVAEWDGLRVDLKSWTVSVDGKEIKYAGSGSRRLCLLKLMVQARGELVDHATLMAKGHPFEDTQLITRAAVRSMMRELKTTDFKDFPDLVKAIRGRTMKGDYCPYLAWPPRSRRS